MLVTTEIMECEALIARLATTAYQAALRQGIKGSFATLELEIWNSMREACSHLAIATEGPSA